MVRRFRFLADSAFSIDRLRIMEYANHGVSELQPARVVSRSRTTGFLR